MNGSKTHRSARSAKALVLGFMLAALMSTMLATGKPAQAGITFTVNSTGDAGTGGCNSTECTLREAIGVTNRVSGADTIRFNIPGSGVKTIKPTSELPAITEAVTIDGYTQPGSSPNTLATGTNAQINIEDGVRIVSFGLATGNRVLRNSIFSNAGLGIDLGGDGLTPNDPGDTDTGPNNLQNKPLLSSATTSSGGTTIVKGKLNSAPNKVFEIHLYSNPSGNEGKKFIGVTNVATDASGNAAFTLSTAQTVAAGQRVTATATSVNGNVGDTSEFSAPKSVVAS